MQVVKRTTSSTEFNDWIIYLRDILPYETTREDWHAACITAEIRRGWVEDKKAVKTDDFLIKFTAKEAKPALSKEEQLAITKAAIFASYGRPKGI